MKSQSPSSISERLRYDLEFYKKHEQQLFSKSVVLSKNDDDLIKSVRVFGLAFHRWHFFVFHKSFFLVSLYHGNSYLYINYSNFPCPVFSEELFVLLNGVFEAEKDDHQKPKKITQAEQKLQRMQGFIDAMKAGEFKGFANKIGTKKKRR